MQKYFSDWILHGVEYGVFGLLLARALHLTLGKSSNFFLVGAVFLLAALYGVSDEWHQSFVPNRQFSAQDIVADGIGAFFGAWGWTVKLRYSRAKEKKVGKLKDFKGGVTIQEKSAGFVRSWPRPMT